ncbi:MAG: sulfotransferase [Pseudoxanthomonas sp.]
MDAASSAAEYGRLDRLLHRLALSAPVLEMSFDLERALCGRQAEALGPSRPVLVCGLARAGTSILMRMLHAAGGFASPAYRDLPFPLAPNTWQRCAGRGRRVQTRERGHGDGLLHDLDTPEAIEEVFWRCKQGEHYLHPQGLAAHAPNAAAMRQYANYQQLVRLRQGGGRYLAKNNNNVLRLPALAQAFAGELALLHPFRDPLQQAASLREQHRRAGELAAADPFRARFMTWLGHHEFGADQRPFLLPGAPDDALPRTSLDYWLAAWNSVHRHLLEQPAPVRACQVFLDYDRFAGEAPRLVARLRQRLQIDALPVSTFRPAPAHALDPADVDPALLAEARRLHAGLGERFDRFLRALPAE